MNFLPFYDIIQLIYTHISEENTVFNYHTHTKFCRHAENTVEEMTEEAVKSGFSEIGFSEHFDRDLRGGYWGKIPYDPKEYADSVRQAKEKYKNKIKVLLGYEMDFYLYNYLEIHKEIMSYSPDYILGSVHRIKGFSFSKGDIPFNYLSDNEIEIILKEYLGTLIAMINSDCITCLDHFDIFKRSYIVKNEDIYYDYYNIIAKLLAEKNIAIELNTHYSNTEFMYIPDPKLYMWNLIRKYDIPVIVSSDCHSKKDLTYKFDIAFDFLKSVGIQTTCRFRNRKIIKEKLIYP